MLEPTTAPRRSNPRALSTREVVEKLIAPHHTYLREAMPFLQKVATKVASAYGDLEPSLVDLATQLDTIAVALTAHMAEEQTELFPALLDGSDSTVAARLFDMRREHEELSVLFCELRRIARDYRPPGWACNSYRRLLYELRALEADVFELMRLETHVLLPRFVR
jgi:regulator of cell morphogenesis and NO signaling